MHHEFALLPDWTIGIQLALFLASFMTLHFLVFKPFQTLLHARHEKTTGLKERAVGAQEMATKFKEDYETFMKTERKKVAEAADKERAKTAAEEMKTIQAARDEVAGELGALRQKVKAEADQARGELLKLVPDYSSLIASKLTGQKIKVSGVKLDSLKGSASDQPEL